MNAIVRFGRRLVLLVRRRTADAAMDAEMRYHIDCEIAERVGRGMSADEARRSAMRDFGGVERHKEDGRDARGWRWLDDGARDVAYAVRVLGRNPGFTAAVAVTFALGIGCTTAIFSLVNGILLRPLPYSQPERLVALWERNAVRGSDHNVVSASRFAAWRDHARSFSGVAALVPAPVTLTGLSAEGVTERITGAQVSPGYFAMLGVRPALGRDFTSADEESGGTHVVILSDSLWRSRFRADSSMVGRSISMDGDPYMVVGVMPHAFDAPRFGWMSEQPLWMPFAVTPGNRSWGRFLHVVARLRPGVTVEQARVELLAMSEVAAREDASGREWSASVVSLAEQITGDVRKPLIVLFAAVLLLLLMSAVNVANLLTGFARRRQHELAVRRAIGATSLRLLRQQLVLSGLLGALGTVVGLAAASGVIRLLIALMPPAVPRVGDVHLDARVLLVTLLAAFVATLAFGGVSALRGLRGTAPSLRVAARATSMGGSRIVTAEIAIGLVLTVLAALMVRTLANLRAVDLGFQPAAVVTARISLTPARYSTAEQQAALFAALITRVRAIPGVTAASLATTRPFACCAPATSVRDARAATESPATAPTTDVRFVDESYFTSLRIPLVAGGAFGAAEPSHGQPRAVISRSLARALWGEASPIGRTVALNLFGTTKAEVIGVIGDVHLADPRTPPRPALFLSAARFPSSERDIIVRGGTDPDRTLAAVRETLASIDPAVPLYRAGSLESVVDVSVAQDRFVAALLSGFALLALALAAVGVYGVLATDVAQRRKEIGIRLALGADSRTLTAMVLRRGMAPACSGVAIGVAVALLLARSMSALVFGVGTGDVSSFAVVTVVLLGVAAAATLIPAVRATRVSPIEAIRTD